MASYALGSGNFGARLKSVLGGPQTGKPNTGAPGGPQVGQPLGGPQTGLPNTGTPSGQVTAGGMPPTAFGGMSGGTGAWERSRSSGYTPGQTDGSPFGGAPQISGGGPPNTGNPGVMAVGGMQGQASRGGIPGASGGTGAWERGGQGQGGTSTFSATNNLIGSQFTPGNDPRQQTAQGYTDSAAAGLNAWSPKNFSSVSPYDPSGAYSALATGNGQMQGMSTSGYRPVAGTDTSGASSWLDKAGGYANPGGASSALAGPGGAGGFSFGAETGAARGMGLDQLKKIMGDSPDRAKLAADSYQLLLDREAPQAAQQDRALAQKTAALGRQGSGMFNSEQMDLATSRERTRDQARRELATNAAGLSLSDQMDKLGAAQGYATSMGGLDTAGGSLNLGYQNSNNAERGSAFDRSLALGDRQFSNARSMASDRLNLSQIGRNDALTERDAQTDAERYGNDLTARKADASRQYGLDTYGIGRDLYGDSVSERDKSQTFDQQQFQNNRSRFSDMTGYEQMVRGNGLSDRNEMRGERDYQSGQDQRAIDNAVRQRELEDRYRSSDVNYADTLFQNGQSQNPYGAIANAGRDQQAQGADAYGAAGDLFSNWAQRRATTPRRTVAG